MGTALSPFWGQGKGLDWPPLLWLQVLDISTQPSASMQRLFWARRRAGGPGHHADRSRHGSRTHGAWGPQGDTPAFLKHLHK